MKQSRILVFDNDTTNRELFDLMLTDEGYEVFISKYDPAALKLVQTYDPNLIILDLNVVQRDSGWEFLQLLKMEDHTAAIPVVVCTTSTRLSREIEGYLDARHISIVRKPFDLVLSQSGIEG
jgi:CheY-like chemotaxis protein